MVQGVAASGNVGVASITALRYAQSGGHDMVVPVRPAQAVYATFRHIQVLPDSRLRDGVPLYKLKILDTLIEELSKAGLRRSSDTAESQGGVAGKNTVDRMIGDVTGALRAGGAVNNAYRAGFLPLPGAFVDLVA